MAVYKVPQDVEADDKLIGPFSFRQFIYLIIVAISMAGAWGLYTVFMPLVIIPLPIILFFAALALPLRKDQPMEAYLSAVVSFYFLKSRRRLWQPDGIDSFVTIIPPKDADKIFTKDLDKEEASRRIGYLSSLVDTHGWAIRGADSTPDTSLSQDLYYETQQTPDMMDSDTPAAQAMTAKLQEGADAQKQVAVAKMENTAPVADKPTEVATPAPVVATTPTPQPNVPSIEEIQAKAEAARRRHNREEVMDAITVANGRAEQEAEERGVKIPAASKIAVPKSTDPEPASAIHELTPEQARQLASQPGVTIATMAAQANKVANTNKTLKSGDEVTIKFR
ncbi:PrgI family protein [Candidatus Saccharibacteria bacterium]|nr:PrgI family protein [Candidatus Saccharibacteria bacterium]